jgi:hypothetical protein
MKKFFLYSGLTLVIQVALLFLAIALSGIFGSEAFILVGLIPFLPEIFFVQMTGNFVGCSNMIDPLLRGIPLGMAINSLALGLIISNVKRSQAA